MCGHQREKQREKILDQRKLIQGEIQKMTDKLVEAAREKAVMQEQ